MQLKEVMETEVITTGGDESVTRRGQAHESD